MTAASPEPSSLDALGKRLLEDLARLKQRVYSEEGIEMFLVCEDLTRIAPPGIAPDALSVALATDLRQHAEALARVRPGATPSDVANIVEVLAERDFGANASGKRR